MSAIRDWPELVTEWRGIALGDVIEIACWPGHRTIVDRIEYHWPRGTVEWCELWGVLTGQPWHDGKTHGAVKARVDASGQPVYHWWHNHIGDNGEYVGHHITYHPIVIVTPAPGRSFVQVSMFGGAT